MALVETLSDGGQVQVSVVCRREGALFVDPNVLRLEANCVCACISAGEGRRG
jgi:uncharacterized circularly permuted ATP-grasp superfamily protein